MAATGLDVWDKTLQTTNIWLDDIMAELGPDRRLAWHMLGAVLRTLRDRMPLELSAHLGAQLPLLVRGTYYEQWRPERQPERIRDLDEFLERVAEKTGPTRPVNLRDAAHAVFHTLARHVDAGQLAKVLEAMPQPIREFGQGAGMAANDATPGRQGESAA